MSVYHQEKAVIDRFEENQVVLETANGLIQIPREQVDFSASEGDVLIRQLDHTWKVDRYATAQRHRRITGKYLKVKRRFRSKYPEKLK